MSKVINIVSNYHLTFEPLNNDKLIHLFTIKPFNFNDDFSKRASDKYSEEYVQ